MQVVIFPALLNRKPDEYIDTCIALYQFVQNESPDLKGLKKYLRRHDLFDKEAFESLMKFLGLRAVRDKPVAFTKPFVSNLATMLDPNERQSHLFEYIANHNEILVKYVMDGLAERLYSTNELYRFVTSYVYPGTYITLLNFKAWMNWIEASKHIKMIGIRWGLSDAGEVAMDYIKTIDVDEILEEEAEAAEAGEDEEVEIAVPSVPSTAAVASQDEPAPASL